MVPEFPVDRSRERAARRFTAVTLHDVTGKIRRIGRGDGIGCSVGGGVRAAPDVLDHRRVSHAGRIAAREGEAPDLAQRGDHRDVEARKIFLKRRRLTEIAAVVEQRNERARSARRTRTLESGPRHHVDGSREGRALGIRGRRKRHLDPRDIARGKDVHGVAATRAAVAATADGTRHTKAVDGNRHVGGGHAVDREFARAIHTHTREKLDELRDVAIRHVAKLVGRDHAAQVGSEALLVDRDGGAAHLARVANHERIELHRRAGVRRSRECRERNLDQRGAARLDRHRLYRRREAGIEDAQPRGPARHVAQHETAVRVGERLQQRAVDGEPRPFEVRAGSRLEDTSRDRAGGQLGGVEGGKRGKSSGEHDGNDQARGHGGGGPEENVSP